MQNRRENLSKSHLIIPINQRIPKSLEFMTIRKIERNLTKLNLIIRRSKDNWRKEDIHQTEVHES
jgi:hypothetical protein